MIFMHEGLPRSGKSYEAVVKHLIGSIKVGREVFAYIEGLNFAKIAECAEISLEQCQDLLHQITREQVPEIYKHVADNSLIIIDEVQNFWPTGRRGLSDEMTRFVAEHGHHGQDILILGQCIKDIHPIWRNRIQMKFVFTKLSALGLENKYSCKAYQASSSGKFELVSSNNYSYDKKYFGTYASHVAEGVNTLNYKDARATVWNHKMFRFAIPAVVVAALIAVWFLRSFFSGDVALFGDASASVSPKIQAVPVSSSSSFFSSSVDSVVPVIDVPPDHIEAMTIKGRPRLSAWFEMGGRVQGVIDWYVGSTRIESLTVTQIQSLGYVVLYENEIVTLAKGKTRIIVTSWPIDLIYQVSERHLDEAGRDMPAERSESSHVPVSLAIS